MDPIGDPVSRYMYAAASPTDALDPSGQLTVRVFDVPKCSRLNCGSVTSMYHWVLSPDEKKMAVAAIIQKVWAETDWVDCEDQTKHTDKDIKGQNYWEMWPLEKGLVVNHCDSSGLALFDRFTTLENDKRCGGETRKFGLAYLVNGYEASEPGHFKRDPSGQTGWACPGDAGHDDAAISLPTMKAEPKDANLTGPGVSHNLKGTGWNCCDPPHTLTYHCSTDPP
jgi:hypothetical protein